MGDTKPFEPRAGAATPEQAEPTAPTPTPGAAAPPEDPAIDPGDERLPAIGARLADRYVLERLVGRGGMGAIYAASDERLRRRVAVKVMLGSAAEIAGFTQRFEREARVASRINHPSCVTVHDFGVDGDRHYLVLEWVEGRSLGALVEKEGALLPDRACALLAQVCDGLAAAHAVGIVHRDVKPDNVMVHQTAPAAEFAKLVDFGIALVTDPGEPHLTQTGLSIGSPNFMSPEQALASDLDGRSDVFSAGATLFFALAGRRPYVGDRMMVMQQILNAPVPSLPSPLDAHPITQVIERAMAKRREDRYATAAELASAIRQAAGPSAALAPQRRPSRRAFPVRTVAVGVGLGAVAAIAAAIALATSLSPSKYGELDRMIAAGQLAPAEAQLAERLRASPEDSGLLLRQGHVLAARGDANGAATAYQHAIVVSPSLASDEELLRNAVQWLSSPPSDGIQKLWRESIGKEGLPALREASQAESRELRWNAIRLRQQMKDSDPPDLVAAWIQDLAPAKDCSLLRGTAEQLRDARDPRALQPLQDARERLNLIDALCAGPVLDDAIRVLGEGTTPPGSAAKE